MIFNKVCTIAAVAMLSFPRSLFGAFLEEPEPIPMIIDTDIGPDCDDAVAIRMATRLSKQKDIEILALGSCVTYENNRDLPALALQAIANYEDIDVPIATAQIDEDTESPYLSEIAVKNDKEYLKAVEVYKDALKDAEGAVIVTTGYMNNIAELLKDPEGFEIVKSSVSYIVAQGGEFPNGWDNNFGFTKQAAESAAYVLEHSPCPIVFITNTVANEFVAGGELDEDDPVKRALVLSGFPEGRAAWDPAAVYIASRLFDCDEIEINPANVWISDIDGSNEFMLSKDGSNFVVTRKESIEKLENSVNELLKSK